MRADVVIPLLIYGFGVYAYGSILVYHIRGWDQDDASCTKCPATSRQSTFAGVAIWTVSLAWFANLTVLTLLGLKPGWSTDPLKLIQFGLQFCFPPLIMHVFYAETSLADPRLRRPICWLPVWASYATCLLIATWALLCFFEVIPNSGRLAGTVSMIALSVLFCIAAVYSIVLLSASKSERHSADERASRRWMAWLFGFMIVLVVVLVVGHLAGLPFMQAGRVIGMSMPLAFCFAAFYHEARFTFFDLFIKRGLALFSTLVLLALYLTLLFRLLEGFDLTGVRPVIYALLLLPVAGSLPWLYGRLEDVLDTLWLGRRFSTVEAVKAFLAGLQSATDERDLVAHAERGLSEILHAPVRIDLELREAPSSGFDCVRDVPIRSGDRPVGVILLGRRGNQTPYFSQDLALVESLADVFAYLLENMRLQQRKQEQEQAARELSLQASRSELKALRAQINPHFLFNALNAIAGLIHKDPLRADNTVEQLAEVFRYTLKGSEKEWALLEDEIDFVRAYLDVEQARFGDRLEVDVRVDASLRQVRVPTMVVQTLVENAVKHGVAAVRGKARIEISARREADQLLVEVVDNGPGFANGEQTDRGTAVGSGFGLHSIRERFRGYYGEAARLSSTRDEERGLTVVCASIPLQHPDATDGDVTPGSAGVA